MPKKSDARPRYTSLILLALPASLLGACGDDITNHYYNYYGEGGAPTEPSPEGGKSSRAGNANTSGDAGMPGEDGGMPSETMGGGGGEAAGPLIDPNYPDAPVEDTPKAEQDIDVFTFGNRWWFAVSDEQREKMNQARWGGGGPGPGNSDIYQPGGGGLATYVDHLWVTTAGEEPQTTDYGKVQVKVVGQSTGRDWTAQTIPNFNIDTNQFIKKQRIGGFEHLRFGNGQVGSIFREKLTLHLFNLLGYAAPLATFAWVSSNVWGSDVSIPYTLVERYKREFCATNADLLGGGCVNMWEYVGDFTVYYDEGGGYGGGIVGPKPMPGPGPGGQYSRFDDPEMCQIDVCEPTRVKELERMFGQVPVGPGFKEGLEDWIAWPEFHQFQCLEWMLGVGDDTIHNYGNNTVLVERSDGKFQFLPYSVDISLGQDWYSFVRLNGDGNHVARGCQADPACWADTVATCETMLEELTNLDPNEELQKVYDELDAEGMLRPGDDARYRFIDEWFTSRLARMPEELAQYAKDPYAPLCEEPYVDCGGWCDYADNCPQQCVPPDDPKPPIGEAGAGPVIDPPMMGVGGGAQAGGAGPIIGGTFGVGGGIMGEGGEGNIPECPPKEEYPMVAR